MKYILATSLLLTFALNVIGATYTTQIHSIDKGKKGQPHLILLTNGHTAFLEGLQKSLIDDLVASQERGDTVEINLDQKLNVISVQTVEPERVEPTGEETAPDEIMSYDPSIVTLTTARNAFTGMRRDYQNESQCYNRAHIWTISLPVVATMKSIEGR